MRRREGWLAVLAAGGVAAGALLGGRPVAEVTRTPSAPQPLADVARTAGANLASVEFDARAARWLAAPPPAPAEPSRWIALDPAGDRFAASRASAAVGEPGLPFLLGLAALSLRRRSTG